jgi:DUF4097 and DUF4098 domain-containing protein YvlB
MSSTEKTRSATFSSSKPVTATVMTKSGDIDVQTSAGDVVEVTLSARGPDAELLLESAEIEFDEKTGELVVRTARDQFEIAGLKNLFRKGAWTLNTDLDVAVVVPVGSSLDVKTASGDTQCRGALNTVELNSASGDIRVSDPVTSLDVKTASGDVVVDRVTESLECRSASGDVRCAGAAARTSVHTASGDVSMTADRSSDITVRAVSGDVRVTVASGLVVDVNANTVSGDMGSSIPLDGSGVSDEQDDDKTVTLNVSTVSGDFRITRAS